MHFDDIVHAFRTRPVFQRLVLAFAVGLIASCAARAADGVDSSANGVSIETGY